MALAVGLYLSVKAGKYVAKTLFENEVKRREGQKVEVTVQEMRRIPTTKRKEKFDDLTLQQVMAMLVDGVYSRDRAGQELCYFVKPLAEGFYEVDLRTEMYTQLHWTRMAECSEEEEKQVGMKHYLRKDRPGHPHPNPVAPRLVIALRGTKLSSVQDLRDDHKVWWNKLPLSHRFQTILQLVGSIVQTFRENHHGKPEDVYITGHSLGAAMAILIGRILATERNERYAVHAFNPPNIPRLYYGMTKNLLRMILFDGSTESDPHNDDEEAQTKRRHFASLVDWVPVLYVNENDIVCNQYLRYYFEKHELSVKQKRLMDQECPKSKALVSILLGSNAKYSSLMPSVDIHVSKKKEHPHHLKQWHKDTDAELKVEVKEYRLMGQNPPN